MDAAHLLRAARLQAGLSQAEVARRAGLPRSVLCAYERGHRQPGADALARVLRAAGFVLRAVPAAPRPDPARAAAILSQVVELAESLPYQPRPDLGFPPFHERVA